jgi:hypothetical protein
VAYIASERSDWLTGQVVGARGYQVQLYNKPEVIRQLASPTPWDLETLFGMIEDSFGPAVGRSGNDVMPRPPSQATTQTA